MVVTTCSSPRLRGHGAPTALGRVRSAGEEQGLPSLRPIEVTACAGQYKGSGPPGGRPRLADRDLRRPRCEIDNWRWAGVPFFLRPARDGRGRAHHLDRLREPPKSMFPAGSVSGPRARTISPSTWPMHRSFLSFYGKRRGQDGPRQAEPAVRLERRATSSTCSRPRAPEADAMSGDQTLFTTARGIERLWEVSRACSRTRRRSELYEPGRGAGVHARPHPPQQWRLPFERKCGGAPRCRRHRPLCAGPVNRGRLNA